MAPNESANKSVRMTRTEAAPSDVERFGFRTSNASIQGGIGSALLIAAGLAWARLTGRIHEPDALYWGGWAMTALLMAAVVWRGHRARVRQAHALGHVELDAERLRWLRADQTVVIEFPWSRVVDAIVEQRTSTIVVVLSPEEPEAPQTATMLGDPGGYVRFEAFDEFLLSCGRYRALKDSASVHGDVRRLLAKKACETSALFAVASALLFGVNGLLENSFSLRHVFPLVPCGLGFLVEVVHGQESLEALVDPSRLRERLALRTMPLAARVVRRLLAAARRAHVEVSAERGGSASLDVAQCLVLLSEQHTTLQKHRAVRAHHVRQLELRTWARGRAHRVH